MLPPFSQRLAKKVRATRSVACVGLDPRWQSLPAAVRGQDDSLAGQAAAFERFCCGIIDVVAKRVPVVKPQLAFFEQLGPAGMIALDRVIRHAIANDLIVLLDGKRNDIGSTAEAYADAYLGRGALSPWGADALTVSPYLGGDSLEPFVKCCHQRGAGIFVLVKTSNPGGGMLQDRSQDGISVYEVVANEVRRLNESSIDADGFGPIGAVVGATYPQQLAALRQQMPSAWILIPGYGAQGGTAKDCAAAFNSKGLGGLVNSSRQIIFAHQRTDLPAHGDWMKAVELATEQMNHDLATVVRGL
jgi:orotidine-5'-phosphate decarboxylase